MMTLYKIIYFGIFILIQCCLSNSNANFSSGINYKKDTCFYTLKIPADLDIPTTPPFDTIIRRSKDCSIHLLELPSWGTVTDYTLSSPEGKERSVHILGGRQKGKIDITDLPAGKYQGYLLACGNGGPFTVEIE
jgi:hypothetical protein